VPEAIERRGIGPERLGNYTLLDRVAMGGMAEIYVAQRREPGRPILPVCIKRMLPHLAEDQQFITMFLDEARIASQLDHPNLVRILELGREQEQYFIAMELVPGEPLSRILSASAGREERGGRVGSSYGAKGGRPLTELRGLPPALAAHVVAQAAAALHHAHQLVDENGRPLRIIHRDISPDNVLVSFGGAVKVIDFGVARAQGRLTQTQHGVAKGKFAYMSPEQARGAPLDHRSDVFSLGVVLWETLAGQRLFQRKSDRETIQAIFRDAVPSLSAFGTVSVELDEIVRCATSKDPEDRFPTADHMRVALEGVQGAMTPDGDEPRSATLGRLVRELMETRFLWWKAIVRSAAEPMSITGQEADPITLDEAARGVPTHPGKPFVEEELTANLRKPRMVTEQTVDELRGEALTPPAPPPARAPAWLYAAVAGGMLVLGGGLFLGLGAGRAPAYAPLVATPSPGKPGLPANGAARPGLGPVIVPLATSAPAVSSLSAKAAVEEEGTPSPEPAPGLVPPAEESLPPAVLTPALAPAVVEAAPPAEPVADVHPSARPGVEEEPSRPDERPRPAAREGSPDVQPAARLSRPEERAPARRRPPRPAAQRKGAATGLGVEPPPAPPAEPAAPAEERRFKNPF
jgi:eukaryotic-like serine/threonine-protein kinase